MRQLDGVTGQRLENEVRDAQAASLETIANGRPIVEVLSQTVANADAAVPQQASDFQGRLAQVVRSHDTLVAQLNQAVQALERAQHNCAVAATNAAQHMTQQEAELAAARAEAATLRESLERQLATANNRAADAEAAAERLTRREAEVAKTVEAHQSLERRFSAALTLLQEQDADLEATTKRLTKREADLAEATETRLSLETKLAEVESALDGAVRRSADDRSTAREQAAQRQSEFDARLKEEGTKYDTLAQDLSTTRQQLADANTKLQEAEARHASAMTIAAAQRTEQEVQHEARMADAVAARVAVSRQLHDATSALDRARQDHLADKTTAAERDRELVARLDQEAATRETLEQALTVARNKIAETETASRNAEHRHALHITTVTARFADQQVQYETRLAEAAAARDVVDQRLREVEVSFERSRQEAAADAAAAAERLARLEAQRVEALANLQMREGQLADANAALRVAEQRAAAERLTAERQAALRQTEFEAAIARETAGRHAVEKDLATSQQKLAESESALRSAEQRHASETKTAAGQFAEQLTQLESELAKATELVVSERAASAERATERQMEFDARLSLELGTRNTIEQALAATRQELLQTEAALRDALAKHAALEQKLADADQRHASALNAAATQLTEQQRKYETRLAEVTDARESVSQQLHDTETTLARIREESDANAIAAAERLSQRESELAAAAAARQVLEGRLVDTETALEHAEARALAERTATMQQAAQRQAEFEAAIARETAGRHAVEQDLATSQQKLAEGATQLESELAKATANRETLERRLAEVTTVRESVSEQLHDTETTLARIRQESDANAIAAAERLSQRESELAAAAAARQVLEGRLVDTETALEHAEARALAERTATTQQSAQRQAEFDAQLAREVEARNVVERDLAETRVAAEQTRQALLGQSAALTAEMRELEVRLTQEIARERAEYESKLVDLQMQLRALNAEREALRQSLATGQAELESLSRIHEEANEHFERIRQAKEVELVRINALVAERDGRMKDQAARLEQLHSRLKAVTQDFEKTRSHRDRLQIEADRVPPLTNQLEASLAESRRQFDGSPIGILRCSEAGVLKEANRALITALGYRTVDELRARGSAASVFETPDDFRWLIATCETPSEPIDWFWKKKDGSRLIMRLRAFRLSADVVEIVAEDLTTLRAAEERLRQAQRMEAVGRLASEVAATCDNLLRNVSRDGQQWLATVGSNTAQRHQGELILGEVTRAASFLRQLSVFGEKQTSALGGVDVNTVWRDLAPVLKRVAGDDIEFVLPKKVFALNVDVDAERVERVLVNIAAYARARMPSGGRLIVELARVVVDREFVSKYPNVRQGAHALISVTEVRTAAPAEGPIGGREPASERPGVDLVALQALIGDCGGHLWMKAEPGGDMEVKIHLPLRSADTSKSAGVVRSALGRSVSAWFQS